GDPHVRRTDGDRAGVRRADACLQRLPGGRRGGRARRARGWVDRCAGRPILTSGAQGRPRLKRGGVPLLLTVTPPWHRSGAFVPNCTHNRNGYHRFNLPLVPRVTSQIRDVAPVPIEIPDVVIDRLPLY